jgi:hypothetical protein
LADEKIFIKSVSVGASHMLALSDKGLVYSWGNGEYGRCGNGKAQQVKPAVIDVLSESAGGGRCVHVAAGPTHSFAVDASGQVWAWGKNEASQLGLGAGLVADLNTMEEYPTLVTAEGDAAETFNGHVVSIAAGSIHTVAQTRDGGVWQWGARTFLSPTTVPFAMALVGSSAATRPLVARAIAAGENVSGVLEPTGGVVTWSKGSKSEVLGHPVGIMGNARAPSLIDAGEAVFSSLSIGAHHALAVVA